jgi:hypothetical protein
MLGFDLSMNNPAETVIFVRNILKPDLYLASTVGHRVMFPFASSDSDFTLH